MDEHAVTKEVARVTERNRRLLGRPAAAPPLVSSRPAAVRPPAATVLLPWIRAVAGFYGVAVDELGASFADGRVMCLLVRCSAAWTCTPELTPTPLSPELRQSFVINTAAMLSHCKRVTCRCCPCR